MGGFSGSGGSSSGAGAAGAGGAACLDSDPEPNDDEDSAYVLDGNVPMDCSDSDVGMMMGTLHDGLDEDWYTYEGEDQITCEANPSGERADGRRLDDRSLPLSPVPER